MCVCGGGGAGTGPLFHEGRGGWTLRIMTQMLGTLVHVMTYNFGQAPFRNPGPLL